MTKFKVGDKVTWCGVPGTVIKDWNFPSEDAATLEVEFEVAARTMASQKQRQTFLRDGRLYAWHHEASLKHSN